MKIIFWTVQDKKVIDTIRKDGIYYPNFDRSAYLKKIPELQSLYDFALSSFNHVNKTFYQGLSFTFSALQDNNICYFDNYDQFKGYISQNMFPIKSLWQSLTKNSAVVLNLKYTDDFNPIYVDINDFQYLMPPFTEQDADKICSYMYNGYFKMSSLPSGIIQGHVPYIRSDNIMNIYKTF